MSGNVDDRIAFLQAIQAEPENDATALIYADWLEEQGGIERAEFIRLEIELANMEWGDERRVPLAIKRERWSSEQLDRWKVGDFSHLREDPIYSPQSMAFEKGLLRSLEISNIRLSKKRSSQTLTELLEKSAIHELRFPHAAAYSELIQELAESPILRRISSLHLMVAPHELVNTLLRSPYASSLSSLTCNIAAFPSRKPNEWFDSLPLPKLRRLRIRANAEDYGRIIRWGWVNKELWPTLLKSRRLAQLTELDVSSLQIGDKGVKQLVQQGSARNWERLNLTGNRLSDDAARVLALSSTFAELRELKIAHNDITQEGAFALAESPVLSRLTNLELDRNTIGYNGLVALMSSRRLIRLARIQAEGINLRAEKPSSRDISRTNGLETGCRVLIMDSSLCDPTDLRAIAHSPIAANLREWSISGNPIGDLGAEALSESSHIKQLQRLRLRNCRIKFAGAETLAKAVSKAMPCLIEADLRFNPIFRDGERPKPADFGPKFCI